MSKTFVIAGTSYIFPEQGSEQPWGEQVTDWAEAVTDTLSGFSSTGDIGTTSVALDDNQPVATNVNGFSFDGSLLQGAIAEYSIYRTNGATGYSEVGHLYFSYNTQSGTWTFSQVGVGVGDTGITITISNTGQVKYTSTNLGGTHSCNITFRAHAFTN